MPIHMGYIGSCKIGTTPYFITGSSINPVQDINVPDLVQGQYQPYAFNWGKIEVGGNVTGPLHHNASSLLTQAMNRNGDGDAMENSVTIEIYYYKGGGRSFNNCQINTLEMSVSSGDVANFTVDFMGAADTGTGVNSLTGSSCAAVCSKLVTWDVCSCSGFPSVGGTDVASMSVTISNNLQRIYALGSNSYAPFTVLAGVQRLSGSIGVYASGAPGDGNAKDSYASTQTPAGGAVALVFGPISVSVASCVFKRAQASATTGPSIYTVEFQGLCGFTATP